MCHTYILSFTGHKVGTQMLTDYLIHPESVKIYFRREQKDYIFYKGMENHFCMFGN